MVPIQAHRNATPWYYDKARLLSLYEHGYSNSLSCPTSCKNPVTKIKGFVKLFGHLTLKMTLVLFCIGIIGQAVISDKLLQDGDNETNSGSTYSIERLVKGSFHRGNKELFGKTVDI